MDALGAAERNCSTNAHGGVNRNKDWGGVPIVLLFGDDYQVPAAVVIDKKRYGATRVIGDDGLLNMALNTIQKEGRNVFLRLSSVVRKLTLVTFNFKHFVMRSDTTVVWMTIKLRNCCVSKLTILISQMLSGQNCYMKQRGFSQLTQKQENTTSG